MQKRTIMAVLLAAGVSSICHFSNVNIINPTVSYTAYAATKGTVTGSSLRVRTGAGTDKKVLTVDGKEVRLTKGKTVNVKKAIEVKDVTWYQVSFSYGGKTLTGYVSGDYLNISESTDDTSSKDDASSPDKDNTDKNNTDKNDTDKNDTDKNDADKDNADKKDEDKTEKPAASTTINAPAKMTATNVNVRKSATTKSDRVGSLKKGTSVKVLKEKTVDGKKWYYISYTENKKTKKGYVLSDYVGLTFSKNLAGTISSSSTKIRKGAGSDKPYVKAGSKEISLKKAHDVIVTREAKDAKGIKWLRISFYYKDKQYAGYVKSTQVKLSQVATVTGKVTGTDNLNVRVAAGTDKKQLTYKDAKVKLKKDAQLNILGKTEVKGLVWYYGTFTYEKKTLKGFVSSEYIEITKTTGVPKSMLEPEEEKPDTEEPDKETPDTENPDTEEPDKETPDNSNPDSNTPDNNTPGDNNTDNNNPDNTIPEGPLSDAEFEAYMSTQGFPEDYKGKLRALHEKHPTWVFKAYQTGLDWNEVIERESKVGLNLISKNKSNGWLSYAEKAYNWATDKFIPYDGSTWVTASREAVAYYMDPRNFLTERAMFQFTALEFQSEYETEEGVEKILANTPLYQTTFSFMDETGTMREMTYAQAFMDAARLSGVSPYHLASRVKQEVVSGTTTLSSSVSGTVPGYEGYYNFYNIGANHSTANGGAVINGLNFAKGDSRTSPAGKAEYKIPWDNQYKAIVGGAVYIGKQYINRGQNTIYLEKFNVTRTSTYTHQYMANVEAANAEATKLYNGYVQMLDSMPLVFNIPVYSNMPAEVSATPGVVPNPNNWLKELKLGSHLLTPEFDAASGSRVNYTLNLSGSAETNLMLSAVPVNKKAEVEIRLTVNGQETILGNGTDVMVPVNTGSSELKIIVTAETKTTNTYTVTLVK